MDRDKPIEKTKLIKSRKIREENIFVMDIPSVTQYAKDYFGCDSIEGVEMETSSQDMVTFDAGSHFNPRMIRDDIMTAHSTSVK